MRLLALLFLSATFLSATATEGPSPSSLLAGPWVILREDGSVQTGAEFSVSPAVAGAATLTRQGATATLELKPVARPLQRPQRPPSMVVEFSLAGTDRQPGRYLFSVGKVAREVVVPALPENDQTARVALIGGWNYPGPVDLDRLGENLGGPVQVVVAVADRGLAQHLGKGGWEARIRLVIIDNGGGDPVLSRLVGAAIGDWRLGARWGALGLPAASTPDAAGDALVRDSGPWRALIAPSATWNPGLMAKTGKQVRGLAQLVLLCRRLDVPVILACGNPAGWVSEPLGAGRDGLTVEAGGPRCLGATPAGECLAAIPREIAMSVDRPALAGFLAEEKRLVVVMRETGGGELLRLAYESGAPGERRGLGWGGGDREELKTAWLAGGAEAARALDELGWLAITSLADLRLDAASFAALTTVSATDVGALRLLRRLTAVEATMQPELRAALPGLSPTVVRDAVLRRLAAGGIEPNDDWGTWLVRTGDPLLVGALLRSYETGENESLLPLILARVRLQASGVVPFERDPVQEHRLLAAVFDALVLNPAELRSLALTLREKVDGLGRGPIERFLKRLDEPKTP